MTTALASEAEVEAGAAAAPRAPLLVLDAIAKSFGRVPVLRDVSLAVEAGQVHALLGENGAGKSTLLKILSGADTPDRGSIAIDGGPVRFATPAEAQKRGIATIYQEFSQFPDLSVAENLRAGRLPRGRLGLVDWRAADRAARQALGRLGLDIDPRRPLAACSVAEQQLVEIARALDAGARLIVMDEPTAALSVGEVARLFAAIADLKRKGIGVIFVGHRLEEVKLICDSFTVLRDGQVTGSGAMSDATVDDLVRLMVGRAVTRGHRTQREPGRVVLDVRGLTLRGTAGLGHRRAITDVSFALRAGEILGLAGLVGAGRTEIARALFGADPVTAGTVTLDGRPFVARTPRAAIRQGLALVPEDRKRQSLFPGLSVAQNYSAAALDRFAGPLGFMARRERGTFEHYRTALDIRLGNSRQPIATLSGGNQQKVVLARWLARQPKVLIVDEPTRGIDIAAKADVHRLLRKLAESDVALLVISSDLPELRAVSDRILTLCNGRLTGELHADEASEEEMMRLMIFDDPAASQRNHAS